MHQQATCPVGLWMLLLPHISFDVKMMLKGSSRHRATRVALPAGACEWSLDRQRSANARPGHLKQDLSTIDQSNGLNQRYACQCQMPRLASSAALKWQAHAWKLQRVHLGISSSIGSQHPGTTSDAQPNHLLEPIMTNDLCSHYHELVHGHACCCSIQWSRPRLHAKHQQSLTGTMRFVKEPLEQSWIRPGAFDNL